MHGDQVDINASHVNNVPSSSDTSRDTGRDGDINYFYKITKKNMRRMLFCDANDNYSEQHLKCGKLTHQARTVLRANSL